MAEESGKRSLSFSAFLRSSANLRFQFFSPPLGRPSIFRMKGLVSLLLELHQKLDAAVAEAYGWPAELSDADILERLVALNQERAAEEAKGHIR